VTDLMQCGYCDELFEWKGGAGACPSCAERSRAEAQAMPLALDRCPRCGVVVVTDWPSFGILFHTKKTHPADGCGYCSHPSRDGVGGGMYKCGICGEVGP
jgi:hypothetical protein